MSGLSRTPGKRVWGNTPPRVRIPPSPPNNKDTFAVSFLFGKGCVDETAHQGGSGFEALSNLRSSNFPHARGVPAQGAHAGSLA
jgi:hypothetical protein